MKPKFTKGDWLVNKIAEFDYTIVVPFAKTSHKNPQLIARVIKEDDANLIKASPTMYENLSMQKDYLISLRHIAESLDEITKRSILMHVSSIEDLRNEALNKVDGGK